MTKQHPSLIDRYNNGARAAFIEGVRKHYAADANAFGDLPQIVKADFAVLSDVTLGELFPQEGATKPEVPPTAKKAPKQPRKDKPRAKKPPTNPGPKAAPTNAPAGDTNNGPDLRTEGGRQAYDDAVYSAIVELSTSSGDIDDNGNAWVKSMDIRAHLGAKAGKPAQMRGAFNRLIESGKITFTGKAAGTKYSTT